MHRVSHGFRDHLVERQEEQLLVTQRDGQQDDSRQEAHHHQVSRRHPQNVSKQEAEEIRRITLNPAHEQDAQGERPGEENADGRIIARPGSARDEGDSERRRDREDRRPEVDVGLEHVRDDDTREGGVGQRVTDECQPAQDDIRSNDRADRPHQDAADESPLHETELEGCGQEIEHSVTDEVLPVEVPRPGPEIRLGRCDGSSPSVTRAWRCSSATTTRRSPTVTTIRWLPYVAPRMS